MFFICIEEHKIVTAVTVSTQDKNCLEDCHQCPRIRHICQQNL